MSCINEEQLGSSAGAPHSDQHSISFMMGMSGNSKSSSTSSSWLPALNKYRLLPPVYEHLCSVIETSASIIDYHLCVYFELMTKHRRVCSSRVKFASLIYRGRNQVGRIWSIWRRIISASCHACELYTTQRCGRSARHADSLLFRGVKQRYVVIIMRDAWLSI